MKTRKYVEEHVAGRWVESHTICDICGRKDKGRYNGWGRSSWDSSEIEIDAKIGSSYPEGDFRDGYRLDVCPDCFTDKLQPLIEKTFGVKFTEYYVDDLDSHSTYYVNEEPDEG